jgi:hypothetical protein
LENWILIKKYNNFFSFRRKYREIDTIWKRILISLPWLNVQWTCNVWHYLAGKMSSNTFSSLPLTQYGDQWQKNIHDCQ